MLQLSAADLHELQTAKNLLENPSVAAKLSHLIGSPIELGLRLLPHNWTEKVASITHSALRKSADAALFTLKDVPGEPASNTWHKFGAALSGGVGGLFGLSTLAIELPISTTIMLRSIADIARSQGESISNAETQLACLQVFALGGNQPQDDAAESGYYMVRAALAQSLAQSAEHLAHKTLSDSSAPVLLRFFTLIAERFGVQVTEKAAAQLLPAVGAAGGAIINTLFIDHFQDMARGHFIIRKLERSYGPEAVQHAYQQQPAIATAVMAKAR